MHLKILNQSFSATNFRKILDLENKKGKYLEGEYFPDIVAISARLKNIRSEINAQARDENNEAQKKKIEEFDQLKLLKDQLLTEKLEEISSRINDAAFKFSLNCFTRNGKQVYTVKKSPELFFALKQVQYNIRRLYKVQQSNRTAILNQVKALLEDNFPKFVIRTDIESFYENIPQDKLMGKINNENLLAFSSKRIIHKVLYEYRALSGQQTGVPRGIGISAYLAELYMRDIDRDIRALPDVAYYARYVDDIVIVFIPTSKDAKKIPPYLDRVKKIISDYGLTLNAAGKTKDINLLSPRIVSLDYLGYKITFGDGSIHFSLTKSRIDEYKRRIEEMFNSYRKQSVYNEKSARKLLIKRVRYLTGNTRLCSNKCNVFVGIYYSHCLLSNASSLGGLDQYFDYKINSMITNSHLQLRLKQYHFSEGFEKKLFASFTAQELSEIMEVWQ